MKTCIVIVLVLFGALSPAHARQSAADETVSRLSRSSAQQLEASIRELNELRDLIASEKLPLAQELTALEERLAGLRRDYDKASRMVDAGHVEMSVIRAEMKARQDELAYIGGILDEYARTFESKVHVSELQYCGEAIEAAKSAVEDPTLSTDDKLSRQLDLVRLSITRLFDVVGGLRFAGVGVDLQGTVTDGQFAIIGPVALFSAGAGGAAGVVVPQSGSTKPLIRPLQGALQEGLASLVQSGEGLLPLDPSRGGALQALVQQFNLIHIFEKGGPIMWPLLLASIIALGVVIERLLFLMIVRMRRNLKAQDAFFTAVAKGDYEEAVRIGRKSKFYVVRALGYALGHRGTSLASAILFAQAQELKRFQRGIPILDTVITLAPLLGLLGTVTGMMGSFAVIGGELSSPGAITGGIAEALIATACGLGIAILALIPFNMLNTRAEQARHEIESAMAQLELLVNPHGVSEEDPAQADSGSDDSRPSPSPSQAEERKRLQQDIRRQIAELQAALDRQPLEPATRE